MWGAGCIMAELWTREPILKGYLLPKMDLNIKPSYFHILIFEIKHATEFEHFPLRTKTASGLPEL